MSTPRVRFGGRREAGDGMGRSGRVWVPASRCGGTGSRGVDTFDGRLAGAFPPARCACRRPPPGGRRPAGRSRWLAGPGALLRAGSRSAAHLPSASGLPPTCRLHPVCRPPAVCIRCRLVLRGRLSKCSLLGPAGRLKMSAPRELADRGPEAWDGSRRFRRALVHGSPEGQWGPRGVDAFHPCPPTLLVHGSSHSATRRGCYL